MATSSCDRGKGKNIHYWNDEEGEALVDVLIELACNPFWKVDRGFKSNTVDGGFKSNYMFEVRNRLVQRLPNFDKDVFPHIDSQIKYLRDKYNSISEMLMQSGCQWNDVEHTINCRMQWYDEWCKTHNNAIGLWNLKFPYLRKLDLVWGINRPTRVKAEDISEACEDINKSKYLSVPISSSDDEGEQRFDAQGPHTSKTRNKLSLRKEVYKKKKCSTLQQSIDTRLDEFMSQIKSICGQMISHTAATTNVSAGPNKSDSLSDEKMQEVMNELLNIGLSTADVGKALEICYDQPTKVKVLFTLPAPMRRSYVLGFLYPISQ